MLSKGDNFRDFLSAYLGNEVFSKGVYSYRKELALMRLLACLPGGRSLFKMGSSLKGKNLLQLEQILSFMR